MKTQSVYVKGTNEAKIHVQTFTPMGKSHGVLHILHGMGEHANRYKPFAEYLTSSGFVVVVHSHRGHGQSLKEGQKVGILDKTDYLFAMVEDVGLIEDYIRTKFPDLPIYMLGHSMGSMILRAYLAKHESRIKKAIFTGTLPVFPSVYVKFMRFLAWFLGLFRSNKKRHKLLAKLLNTGMNKHIKHPETTFDWLSHDHDVVMRYIDDPLSGFEYNKRFYRSFFALISFLNRFKFRRIKIPILMVSGEEDPLNYKNKALDSVSKMYKKKQETIDLTIEHVPRARHEVLNEIDKEKTYEYLKKWLNA